MVHLLPDTCCPIMLLHAVISSAMTQRSIPGNYSSSLQSLGTSKGNVHCHSISWRIPAVEQLPNSLTEVQGHWKLQLSTDIPVTSCMLYRYARSPQRRHPTRFPTHYHRLRKPTSACAGLSETTLPNLGCRNNHDFKFPNMFLCYCQRSMH